jgi:hypothetical protein
MPPLTNTSDIVDLLKRRHCEHEEFELRWQWEQDTLEGGNRYRTATYGTDAGGFNQHNLIRYKRDWSAIENQRGADPQANAIDSDFAMRLARTPPPTFLEEAISIHLSKVYKTNPQRKGPAQLERWWKDVDGKGTSIDEWMSDTIAPLFLVNAQIDICFDHPRRPDGEIVNTRADEIRLGLTKCVASYILPQNMLWWRLDNQDRYIECIVREPQDEGIDFFRHWTTTGWTLYSQAEEGDSVEVVDQGDHPYGRPPIERVLYRRRPRCSRVGVSLYEAICEYTRAYYNLDSELVLSDSLQAHPTLQGPAELLANGVIQVGPANILPMIETQGSDSQVTYTGFEYIDPPKGAADSIRLNKQAIRDEIDRIACLAKPAGAQGNTGSVVSQSGLSKVMDQSTGNDLLSRVAGSLARLERVAACLALLVLGDGKVDAADEAAIQVSYPKTFELADTVGLTQTIEGYQTIMTDVGACPKTETRMVKRLLRVALPGLDPDVYDELDEENEAFIESKASTYDQDQEAAQANAQANASQKKVGSGAAAADDDIVEEDEEP